MPNENDVGKICRTCLWCLPDAEDYVCVCEEGERYADLVEPDEVCEKYLKRCTVHWQSLD